MKLGDLKEGDIIVANLGWYCLPSGNHVVHEHHGRLWVPCKEGHHFLDGNLDEQDEHLIDWSKQS